MMFQCGGQLVEVHIELADRPDRSGHRQTVYVPDCCSGRWPSFNVLQIAHMNGCPRDRQIRAFLESEGSAQ